MPLNAPLQTQTMPVTQTIVPTTQMQENFTQEQLARAMANAPAIGHSILQNYGVQSFMQINPSEYNKIAVMLRNAGVEV